MMKVVLWILGVILGLALLYFIIPGFFALFVNPKKEYKKDSRIYRFLLNVASGIGLMLVQKEDGIIKLLPALPKELSSGSLYGMKLKGGISLDMTWCDGKVTSAFLTTKKDCTQKVLCDGKLTEVTLKSGERIKII